ncbi:MAG TPA: alpha/beta fold hydrolase [Acidimicrobiales bacterium]
MERFTSADGVEIVYDIWPAGEGSSGAAPPGDAPAGEASSGGSGLPPVVLHHGFIADANINWVAPGVVGALAGAGRTVVALDARGHGRSGKPHDPAAYGEDVMARDLSALLDVLGAPAVDLVGYSMGAVVALIAASREPRIRRLVVGGVGAGIVELGGVDTRILAPDALVAALQTDDPDSLTDPQTRAFRAFADAVGADRRALAAQAASVHAAPIALARITAPTLVLAGDADPLAGRPEVLAAAIPGAELRLVPGDHLAAVAEPAFAAHVVAFLGEA